MSATAIDLLAPVHRAPIEQHRRMDEAGLFDDDVRVELIDGSSSRGARSASGMSAG